MSWPSKPENDQDIYYRGTSQAFFLQWTMQLKNNLIYQIFTYLIIRIGQYWHQWKYKFLYESLQTEQQYTFNNKKTVKKTSYNMHYSPYRRFKQNCSPSTNNNQQSRIQNSHMQTVKRQSGNNSEQIQIQDLQQKVEIILSHNQKLIAENQELKRALVQGSHDKSNKIVSIAQENQRLVRNLRDQLYIKGIEFDRLTNEVIICKNQHTRELELMTDAINSLTSENERYVRQVQQARKLKVNFDNMLQQQLKSVKARMNLTHEEQIEELKKVHQGKLASINNSKMQAIVKLEECHEKEKKDIEESIKKAFAKQINKLEGQILDKCKDQREKAEIFIKSMMDNVQFENNVENQTLKKQIEALRNSLQSRKKILIQYTEDARDQEQSDDLVWFNELIKAKKEFAEYTNHFLRESELLKLKMSHQHQIDVKHVSKSFQAQIEVLCSRIGHLEDINSDLRVRYQEQIRGKLVMKQNFQIKLSQLKNLIKKLKLDLDKVSDDYRISIDGIKSSQIALSSHLIIDVQRKKNKENFYQQQLKKLRHHLDKKDDERALVQQQCSQKIKYYIQKMTDFQQRLNQREQDFEQKEKELIEQFDRKQDDQRKFLEREKASLKQVLAINQREMQKIKDEIQPLKDKNKELLVEISQRKKDIDELKQKLESANAHIEALKLEMDMRGNQEKNEQAKKRQSWKNHYERRIKQLEQDKENLKQSSEVKQQQMTQLLVKYKDLESSLEKTMLTMKKRTTLEKQVVQLGMDQNLVKNLAELF